MWFFDWVWKPKSKAEDGTWTKIWISGWRSLFVIFLSEVSTSSTGATVSQLETVSKHLSNRKTTYHSKHNPKEDLSSMPSRSNSHRWFLRCSRLANYLGGDEGQRCLHHQSTCGDCGARARWMRGLAKKASHGICYDERDMTLEDPLNLR